MKLSLSFDLYVDSNQFFLHPLFLDRMLAQAAKIVHPDTFKRAQDPQAALHAILASLHLVLPRLDVMRVTLASISLHLQAQVAYNVPLESIPTRTGEVDAKAVPMGSFKISKGRQAAKLVLEAFTQIRMHAPHARHVARALSNRQALHRRAQIVQEGKCSAQKCSAALISNSTLHHT